MIPKPDKLHFLPFLYVQRGFVKVSRRDSWKPNSINITFKSEVHIQSKSLLRVIAECLKPNVKGQIIGKFYRPIFRLHKNNLNNLRKQTSCFAV